MTRTLTTSRLVLVALLCLGLARCDADDAADSGSLTLGTYNAGLAIGFVDYAPQRAPLIGPALSGQDVDVICLQEVWTQEHAEMIVEATKAAYPHSYYELTDPPEAGASTGPACPPAEADPLLSCSKEKCGDVDPANLVTCVMEECKEDFDAISDGCLSCLASKIGSTIDDMMGFCSTDSGGSYAYDGRNGLIILSKHALSGKEMTRFDSYLNVRVALHAKVTGEAFAGTDVYCTHLTANLSNISYGGPEDSWGAEQAKQIDALIAWVSATEDTATPTAVLGDMNCGLDKGTTMIAELPENFQKFVDAGYDSFFVTQEAQICSWCNENPLIGGGDDKAGEDHIIDHVLTKGFPEGTTNSPARFMDDVINLTTDDGDLESRFSDHYGVSVEFK